MKLINAVLFSFFAAFFAAIASAHENDHVSFIYEESSKDSQKCFEQVKAGSLFLDTSDCVEMQKRAGEFARHYFCHKTGDAASCRNHPVAGIGEKNALSRSSKKLIGKFAVNPVWIVATVILIFVGAGLYLNRNRNEKILRPLCENNNNDDLIKAVCFGQSDEVNRMMAAGANPNTVTSDGETVLSIAKKNGDIKIIRLLEEAGAKE